MSQSESPKPLPTSRAWSPPMKMAVGVISLVVIGIGLWQIANIFPLIVLVMLFAYLLTPLTASIEKRLLGGKRRSLAVLLTLLVFAVVTVLVLLLLVPPLVTQIGDFAEQIPQFLRNLQNSLNDFLSQPLSLFGQTVVPLDYLEQIAGTRDLSAIFGNINPGAFVERVLNSLTALIAPTFGIVGRVFGTLISLTIFITLLFYLLRDGQKFIGHLIRIVPDGYEGDARRGFHELNVIWSAYLRGQLLLCLVIGVLTYIAALILGLPSPLIIGVIAGFLELIPNIGPLITAFITAALALISESTTFAGLSGVSFALIVIVVQVIIQQLEAIVFVPRIMGDSLELHPFAVMVAVLAGGALAGALGVILAAPGLATARLVIRYIYAKLSDHPPFGDTPPQESESASPRAELSPDLEA